MAMWKSLATDYNASLDGTPNLAYLIAGLCRYAANCVGLPGEAKTILINMLASVKKKKYYRFIPSLHQPEDLSGLPHLPPDAVVARMVPMEFVAACQEPDWVFFFDEINTADRVMRPPLLSLLQEGEVGKIKWHPSTLRFAACNPEEWAPDAAPLEPSLCNRMFHCQWEFPANDYFAGLRRGFNFEVSYEIPEIPADQHEALRPVIGTALATFLENNPHMLRRDPKNVPTAQEPFTSPRTWHWAGDCLAGAIAAGAPVHVYQQIMEGWVGTDAASAFMTFLGTMDLYDVDALVEGREKPDPANDRLDRLIHLPWCMVCNLETRVRNRNIQEQHFENVISIMLDLAEANLLDCCVAAIHKVSVVIRESGTDWEMPPALWDRWTHLIESVYA